MKETILLTGFEPFGPHPRNISGEAVQRLDGTEIGTETGTEIGGEIGETGFVLRSLVLPVELEGAKRALDAALTAHDPAAVISTGIFAPTPDEPKARYRIELAAKNEQHYTIPDAAGQLVRDRPVEVEGPAMVFSSLPIGAIKLALCEHGLDAELSEDAGRYLCNAVFYWTARRRQPSGFVHLPADVDRLDEAVLALRTAAEVTATRLAEQRVEATA